MNSKPETFYSNGKLLITGEYLVLDGALSLAMPTKYGQSLTVEPIDEQKLIWESIDENSVVWFRGEFEILNNKISLFSKNDNNISNRLIEILNAAKTLNSSFLKKGFKVTTKLSFPKNWGLGTSSTLINNIANWAKVDAYQLLALTFGGSGYDIACAEHNHPITYQLEDAYRIITEVHFKPSFEEHLYFVYLNKKQDSREGIAQYKANASDLSDEISAINRITKQMIACQHLDEFQTLIDRHEQIISNIIKQTPIKDSHFSDFSGSIKSLGAWGGDFVLVASKSAPMDYFKTKGFDIVIPFKNMKL